MLVVNLLNISSRSIGLGWIGVIYFGNTIFNLNTMKITLSLYIY